MSNSMLITQHSCKVDLFRDLKSPKLTFHSEVDLQLDDSKGVLAAAEVDAFVVLADVEYGQLELSLIHI